MKKLARQVLSVAVMGAVAGMASASDLSGSFLSETEVFVNVKNFITVEGLPNLLYLDRDSGVTHYGTALFSIGRSGPVDEGKPYALMINSGHDGSGTNFNMKHQDADDLLNMSITYYDKYDTNGVTSATKLEHEGRYEFESWQPLRSKVQNVGMQFTVQNADMELSRAGMYSAPINMWIVAK